MEVGSFTYPPLAFRRPSGSLGLPPTTSLEGGQVFSSHSPLGRQACAIESPGDVGRDRPSVNSRRGSLASSRGARVLGRSSQASSSSMEAAGPAKGCWMPM